MASAALEKMIRNIKNWDRSKAYGTFNYFTTCCHQAYYRWLSLHYRRINAARELAKAAA